MADRFIIEDLKSDRWRLTRHIGVDVGCDSHGYMAWVEPQQLRAYGDTEGEAIEQLRTGIRMLCNELLDPRASHARPMALRLRDWLRERVERAIPEKGLLPIPEGTDTSKGVVVVTTGFNVLDRVERTGHSNGR